MHDGISRKLTLIRLIAGNSLTPLTLNHVAHFARALFSSSYPCLIFALQIAYHYS